MMKAIPHVPYPCLELWYSPDPASEWWSLQAHHSPWACVIEEPPPDGTGSELFQFKNWIVIPL